MRNRRELVCGRRVLPLGERTLVMGILNVTPDSFSDGGRFVDLDQALAQARAMVEAGADIIDIGGESTRPGAEPVDEAQELDR
ncbi:dihydropteroate synthase, partial [Bacillus sp. SIMBA_069]